MKNIPVFTAAGGTATLILREIPKCRRAYVILQTHTPGMESTQARECAAFCRMAGAAEVYASCADGTELDLTHSHDMLRLSLERAALQQSKRTITLQPLTAETRGLYIEHFNLRFGSIHNAAMTDQRSLERAAANGSRHFLAFHRDQLIGLGAVCGNELEAIAAVESGWGYDLACTLLAETIGDPMELTVCSVNAPAIRLYDALGFHTTALVSRWWSV